MGSTLLLKVRICLKPLKPFFHQGGSLSTSLCKSPQLPLSARFLCTRHNNPNPRGGQADRRDTTTVRQKPVFPKSVFAAGTAKRTAEIQKRREALVFEEEEQEERRRGGGGVKLKPPDRPLSAAEWRNLKESLGNHQRFDILMMNSLFASGAQLDIAKSLLTFVAMETGTLPYEMLLRYLTICVGGGHDDEVFDVYDIMRGSFPTLETGASTLFIKAFSRTARWRDAIGILEDVKKVFTPSTSNYDNIISAAMTNGDATTAWSLYDELMENGLSPHQQTWEALFQAVRKTRGEEEVMTSESEHQERLLGVLLHMRNNQIYPQQNLASSIKTWFESLTGQRWTGSWTSATPKGLCRSCGSQLESIQLTADEYQQLKDRVMTDIIQGPDVFKKTTPEELERFKAFVKRKPAFDVVVDGLNVANLTKDKTQLSETLLAVVSELHRQGLTVLVLGRKHMQWPSRSWKRQNMNLIQQKAHCFFTDNISEDDPFLLYATLHSGNHCRFVSQDLMRDHKACLPDGASRRFFFKWQRGHQLAVHGYIIAGKRVRFQSILSYDTIIQTSEDSWHVPYDDTEDRSSYEVPQRWLCLHKKH